MHLQQSLLSHLSTCNEGFRHPAVPASVACRYQISDPATLQERGRLRALQTEKVSCYVLIVYL